MSEEQWQQVVVDYAILKGWLVWHDQDPRRNGAGFPDLLLIRDRVVWAELKTQTGRVSYHQAEMHARLEQVGAEVHVWRPSMWPDVQATLDLNLSPKRNGS
jgi:hypothetical protein